MFFLLCRHTDDGVFDDFLKSFEDFLKLFRRPEAGSYILKGYAKQPLAVRTTTVGLHSFRHLASNAWNNVPDTTRKCLNRNSNNLWTNRRSLCFLDNNELVFILYILRFSHQILLCEKAFRIFLLRPIREAKRVSHTWKYTHFSSSHLLSV